MNNENVSFTYPQRCSELAIHKSSGVTESEEKLCRLGYHTFLSLWSYPNVFQKHKLVKELCDLLVVFENHIIIFSDKDCAFGNSGDITTDWIRWYKKSILASAKQLCGAKSWICKCPDRICLDEKGEIDFALQRYRDWRRQLKSSYFWDSLLQRTFYYIENGLSLTTTPTIEAQSELFRYLARENRFHRASLAHSFLSFFSNTPEDFRGTRIIYNQDDPSICYVLFLLPRKQYMKDEDYRKVRIDMLKDYCAIAKSDLPQTQMIIGVAHETNEEFGSSEDFIALDASKWTEADQEQALQVKEEYISKGLIGKRNHIACSYHRTTAPEIRRLKGKDRNKPCPCGSGKKYKKCCGAIRQ